MGGMWGCWADVWDVVMGGKGAGMEGQGAAGGPGGCWEAAQGRALTLLSALHGSGGGQRLKVSRDRLPVRAPTSGQSPHFWSEAPTSGPATHTPPPPRQQFPVGTPNLESKFPSSDLGPPLPVRPRPLPVTTPHCRSERPNFQSELPTSAPTSQLPLRTLEFRTELPTSGLKPPHFRSEFFISKVNLVFCSKPHFQPETPLLL